MSPELGTADAEIKVPFVENLKLSGSPFIARNMSVSCHACHAYCQGFLPCYSLPSRFIDLHFFQNLSEFFSVLAVANTGSCMGPQNKIGHPVRRYRQLMQVPVLSARRI